MSANNTGDTLVWWRWLAGPRRWHRSRYIIALSLYVALWVVANTVALQGAHYVDGKRWLLANSLGLLGLAWIAAPRLRDFGWHGWSYFVFVLLGLRVYILLPIALLVLAFVPGHPQTNQFGEPDRKFSRQAAAAAVVALIAVGVIGLCLSHMLAAVSWH